ncbi:MAG: hypothetical protein ACO3JL_13240, partial [Myxococcota bacterium]
MELMVERSRVDGLPKVGNGSRLNKGPVAQRQAFYRTLPGAFVNPALPVERDATREDKYGHSADSIGRSPGVFVANLPGAMSPSVRFEVGRVRIVPFVEQGGCSATSWTTRQRRQSPGQAVPHGSPNGSEDALVGLAHWPRHLRLLRLMDSIRR